MLKQSKREGARYGGRFLVPQPKGKKKPRNAYGRRDMRLA